MPWMKRISSPKWWPIERKTHKYVAVPRGAHKIKLPLLVVIRDVLKLGETAKEAKTIITSGKVFVDGKKRRDIRYGVGPMDLVNIPVMEKTWRAVPRNGLTFIETSGEDAKMKVCKIRDKKILRGNKTQLNMLNGRNILTNDNYSTNDSLILEMPSQKILDKILLKEGNLIIVTGGKYEGMISTIDEIDNKNRRIWTQINSKKVEIPIKLTTVIGKDKPAVKIE